MTHKTKGTLFIIIILTVLLGVLTAAFFILHRMYQKGWMNATAISCLTTFYHLAMRLAVGEAVTLIFAKREFPKDRLGFRLFGFEEELYRKLKVKKWIKYAKSAKPEQFDLSRVTPRELLHNVMQAELVHRIIMILSFVPLLFIIPFGEPFVFILTSIIACFIDLFFVIIQRFNRPRVEKLVELRERNEK